MDKLGIEPSLLLAQIVNFSIIVFVMQRLLYKPILEMLRRRKAEIAEGLSLTEKLRAEEEKLTLKHEKLLEIVRKEGQELVAQAQKQAKLEEKEILAHAQKEAQGVIEKGKLEVERQKKDMEHDLRAASIDLAVAMAKKLLSETLGAKEKHEILKKHIRALESVHV